MAEEVELGVVDGWRISAKKSWWYDDETKYDREWKYGNLIELTAIKDDEDRDSGISHVRFFKMTPAMVKELLEFVQEEKK